MEITVRATDVAPRMTEVPMIEPDSVRQMRQLHERGWGAKRIARELGIARNTVRRYLRGGAEAESQVRPSARRLDEAGKRRAIELFDGAAEGNAVVVAELLTAEGYEVSARTLQRLTSERRRALQAAAVASVRFETAPGAQMQIDFGQKLVSIAGTLVRVYLLVAVLSYSRRLFVKPFLAERQDDWREGIAGAFRHFGGVTRTLLGDNARSLVVAHNRVAQTVTFHPAYVAFCRDWDVVPRACAPYRARTKGKTESGVKYVKRNALAGRRFESFAELEAHLTRWMQRADERVHGTTYETPRARFEREAPALRPLPARPIPGRERCIERRVSNDALVDVDTVRYSVPHRLVRDRVSVRVGEQDVRIYHGTALVATHARSFEPHAIVRDPAHYVGLWRATPVAPIEASPPELAPLGRSLDDYAAVVQGGGA
jgi:transposase